MKRTQYAISFAMLLNVAAIALHLCILTGLIPYEITWGGRLENAQQMYVFESISIAVLLPLLWALNWVRSKPFGLGIRILLWIYFVLFSLNTIGNLFAKTNFEKAFAGVTLFQAVVLGMILFRKQQSVQK